MQIRKKSENFSLKNFVSVNGCVCVLLRNVLKLLSKTSVVLVISNQFWHVFQESKFHAGGSVYHSENDGSPMFQRDLKSLLERCAANLFCPEF